MINDSIDINDFQKDFSNWIDNLRRTEKTQNTIRSYKNGVNKFIEYLKEEDITEINKDIVLNYKDTLILLEKQNVMKIATVNQRIISLNKFLRDNNLNELTVKSIPVENGLKETLTESDYNRLIRWADKLDMKREKLIMKTLANTGIRVSELEYFTVENLKKSGRRGIIEVHNKGKYRQILVTNELKKELLDYAKEEKIKKGVIFHSKNDPNKLLDTSQIWRNLKYIAGRARVKKSITTPHNFRHLFARQFLKKNGENAVILKRLLGHSDIKTTELYIQSVQEDKELLKGLY